MKFVLFNIAVMAALFVLFNQDHADFQALADKASDKVRAARGVVEKAVGGEEKPINADPEHGKSPQIVPVKTIERTVVEKKTEDALTSPAPDTRAEPTPEPEVKPVRTVAREPVSTPQPAVEPTLDPAVAKRRAEVLGLAPSPSTEALPPATDKLMSAEQRRRELYSLAEEMELFYVKRLSR